MPFKRFLEIILILFLLSLEAKADLSKRPDTSLNFMAVSTEAKADLSKRPDTTLNFMAGIGTIYQPAFFGSKDYQLLLIPNLKIDYKNLITLSIDGLRFNFINSGGWRAGAGAKYNPGRNESEGWYARYFRLAGDKQSKLQGLGDVDYTIELGGFVQYTYNPFTLKFDLYQGINGHESFIGNAGLQYNGTIPLNGTPIIFSLGAHTTFAGSKYNNAYYGIDEKQSERSGLDRYHADRGFISYGADLFIAYPVTPSVLFSVFGKYDRLSGEISNSPIIVKYGSENQYICGIMFGYRFGL